MIEQQVLILAEASLQPVISHFYSVKARAERMEPPTSRDGLPIWLALSRNSFRHTPGCFPPIELTVCISLDDPGC